ncbi:MAG: hypothetical protein ACTSV2_06235 [Candidatus Thorarchaeota archaeon]
MRSKTRFFFPGIFTIVGIGISLAFIYFVTYELPSSFDFVGFIEGTLFTDVAIVLALAIPILFIVYIILGIPFAALYLFGNRLMKASAYDLRIEKLGENFGGIRIIRRAVAPALFSVSFAGLILGLIEGFIFATPPSLPLQLEFIFPLSLTLMASLIIMPIAIILFVPTWILSDAGLVTQLKKGQLEIRQCPDTEGVGRWFSNSLGGFSLVTFPLTMFYVHFYTPFVILGHNPDTISLLISTLWTIGLPLGVMAFIIPVVLFHERLRNKSVRFIQGYAKRLGADDSRGKK